MIMTARVVNSYWVRRTVLSTHSLLLILIIRGFCEDAMLYPEHSASYVANILKQVVAKIILIEGMNCESQNGTDQLYV